MEEVTAGQLVEGDELLVGGVDAVVLRVGTHWVVTRRATRLVEYHIVIEPRDPRVTDPADTRHDERVELFALLEWVCDEYGIRPAHALAVPRGSAAWHVIGGENLAGATVQFNLDTAELAVKVSR